ncbi:MAG: hypothetical protein BIP78_0971 [Candidatus Bipolaricaulis sibiricus]|uniref:Uncharacterized protein n=1 Tax=Bipolaricaulis sibiricus TaxID=2501609 RepID=A0A410FUI1_BIPS1|nr:MAG: hypothetical protein BIP78_0971 [Candidatus Bipolaricaulis sibiricus]
MLPRGGLANVRGDCRLLAELQVDYPGLFVHRFRLPSGEGRVRLDELEDLFGHGDVSVPVLAMFVGDGAVGGGACCGLAE